MGNTNRKPITNVKTFDALVHQQDVADVKAALDLWVRTMKTRDPFAVTALYAPDATFWGTLATDLADDQRSILGYFKNFLQRTNLQIEDISGDVQSEGKHRALYAGNYTFKFEHDGQRCTVPARFSFMYRKNDDGEWQIVHHHSSAMPQAPASKPQP